MPKAYILVGIPGSGKSTWIKNQTWTLGLTVVSTDVFVEDYAKVHDKTYTEAFAEYMPTAIDLMVDQVVFAREHGHDIIWDQTSVTVASRIKKFNMLPGYEMIAVVFPIPGKEELTRRLNSRPGKIIPDNVIQQMIDSFEMPTTDEGFTTVIRVGRKNGPQETN
jgi:predicted kinase